MSHPLATAHVAHLLPAFVAGTLAADERREVAAHLADCPACRAELAAWRTIDDALGAPLPLQPAGDATLQEVWRRVDATPQTGRPLRFNHRHGIGYTAGPASVGSAPRRQDATGGAVTAAPRPAAQAWAAVAARQQRPLRHLAAAALLVLSLGLGYIAFKPGWPSLNGPVQQLAAPEPATAPGEVARETLLDAIIPTAYVPTWDRSAIGLALVTIPPGNTSTWETPALRVEYLLDGEYRVRGDGPSLVIRRGAVAPDEVPAGAELVMTPGDTLIAPAETMSDYATAASSGAQILNWVVEEENPRPAKPGSWRENALDHRHDLRLQNGALSLRLLRIDLGPDAALAAPDDPLQLVVQADFVGSTIAMTGEGERRNIGETSATLYSATVSPSGTGTLMP